MVALVGTSAWGQGVRPKIGVTMSGGGAKGAAHIGVLKYMEEQGIPVDYVTGTSMGSIIGALYSIGYSPDEMAELIGDLDWPEYITNSLSRRYRSASAKQKRSAYLFAVPFNLGKLDSNVTAARRGNRFLSSLPSSFMGGNNVTNLLNDLSLGYQDSISFDSLPVPFGCVATDITTGDAVVLRSGRLPVAVRASMAIPGMFSPVKDGKHVLVDGGMVNNFPVDVCKEMGAEIVIGSDVASEVNGDVERLNSLPQLVSQLMDIAVKGNTEETRPMCDIYLRPDISGYNMLSFTKEAIDTLVARGYRAAQAHAEEFAALKARLEPYGPLEPRHVSRKARMLTKDTLVIMDVKMTGVSEADERWLKEKSRLQTGTPVSGEEVKAAVNRLKGTGAFSTVTYNLTNCNWTPENPGDSARYNSYTLEMDFVKAAPHAFALGFRFDTEEWAAVLLDLGFNRNKLRGFKADIGLRLAANYGINVTGKYAVRHFATFNLAYDLQNSDFKLGNLANVENFSYTAAHFYKHRFSFYLSEFYLRNISCAAGIDEELLLFDRLLSSSSVLVGNDNMRSLCLGVFGKFKYDSRDDSYFARQGANVQLDAHWRIDNSQLKRGDVHVPGFADIAVSYQHHFTPGNWRITFIPQIYTRAVIGSDYHFAYRNMVGGELQGRYIDHQMPFVGVLEPQQAERCLIVARLDIRCNVYKKHYVSAVANYLASADAYWHYFSDNQYEGRTGFALQYAYDSPIGPLAGSIFWSDVYRRAGFYISLGYTF